jgi:hypothetical protein
LLDTPLSEAERRLLAFGDRILARRNPARLASADLPPGRFVADDSPLEGD